MGKRIIHIEDNPDMVFLYGTYLRKYGFEVDAFSHPRPGLAAIRERQPDLVIMDVQLPDIDGIEATRQLKSDPATAKIPIIILTVFAKDTDRQAGLAAGCDAYLTKPLSPAKLLATINELVVQDQHA